MSRKGTRKGTKKGTRKGKNKTFGATRSLKRSKRHRKARELRRRMSKELKKGRNIQKGGVSVHYIISSHGSTSGVNIETDNKHPNRKLFSYVEYGEQLDIECGFALQHWLSKFRDDDHKPRCQYISPYITSTILNAKLYVEKDDEWNSGIVDVTTLNEPEIVQTWNHIEDGFDKGFTLQKALDTIHDHFIHTYNPNWTYSVHILTCL